MEQILLIVIGILSVGFHCYALGTPIYHNEEESEKEVKKK